ncbi:tetratricopeptide repeat protein [Microcoleus sp. MON1_C1]|uniref:tetratricopeptide repeat protein n=1 Tax=Microcoleus sp. MON1_C1 TaxID=2818827 RepID=UPI002FD4DEDB
MQSTLLLPAFTVSRLVTKIEKNTKGVAMLDRAQWFFVGMLIALSVQLSQPVAAAVPAGKTVQTAQSNSSGAADKLYKEGVQLYTQGTVEAKRSALVKLEEALKLYRQAGDKRREPLSLLGIGKVYNDLGENQKALEYYSQSLPLFRAVGDRGGEATTLYNIGGAYLELGENQKALEYYSQSLPLFRAIGNRSGEALTLNNAGLVYSKLGEKQKALEYYSQSLPLFRAVGDRGEEATTLNNIGLVYSELGENQKALEYYSQSLPLTRAVGDRGGEAVTLYNIASVKRHQNNLTEALNDIESSLKIIENLRNKITNPELHTSHLSQLQNYYKFYIDLLMQLHQANPNSGYDVKASEARKRASNP